MKLRAMPVKPDSELVSNAGVRQLFRTPLRKSRLLRIAGRVQGVPKISFDAHTLGSTAIDAESADVCGSMEPNRINAMMRPQLVSETPMHAIGFTDILRRPVCI